MRFTEELTKMECCRKASLYSFTEKATFVARRRNIILAGGAGIGPYLKEGKRDVFEEALKELHAELTLDFPWQLEEYIAEDSFKWYRVLDYIKAQGGCYEGESLFYETPIGTDCISLIYRIADAFHGVFFTPGKVRISNRATSERNKSVNDLRMACAKMALNERYPGITIHTMGLTSKDDKSYAQVGAYLRKDDAFSDFSSIENLSEHIQTLLAHVSDVCADCDSCSFDKKFCNLSGFRKNNVSEQAVSSKDAKKVFTKAQEAVICHKDGPARIAAGPGSGKTAVLVERVAHLIEQGVNPLTILVVTFSKSATAELQSRIQSRIGATQLPTISTLNALGYDIIGKASNTKVPLGRKVARYRVIHAVLLQSNRLTNACYSSSYEDYGLVPALDKVFAAMDEGTEDLVLSKYKYDAEELRELYKLYTEYMTTLGYISYDEQISRAVDLLQNNDAVRRYVQSMYHYVMVDEYQDVNEMQSTMIDLISGKYKNLVVVGDDDQEIYSFRKASNEYMLNFPKRYPDAKTIVLSDNFRSTKEIVAMDAQLISYNQDRIEKRFVAHRSGVKPIVYRSFLDSEIVGVVQGILDRGYRPGDIAVIARTNKPLQKIKGLLDNARLNRSFLYEDHVFQTIRAVLSILDTGFGAASDSFLKLALLTTDIEPQSIPVSGSFYESVLNYQNSMDKDERIADMVQGLLANLRTLALKRKELALDELLFLILDLFYGEQQHPAVNEILDMFHEQEVVTLHGASSLLSDVELFRDDTKIQYGEDDSLVTLLTAHDAKGKEFPIVILYGLEDFDSYKDTEKEDARRLLYVALTRAETELFICEGPKSSSYIPEFGEEVQLA